LRRRRAVGGAKVCSLCAMTPAVTSPSAPSELPSLSRFPPSLLPLGRLAYHYWWSWKPGGEDIFRALDPELWDTCGHNPVRLLIETPRLKEAAENQTLVARAAAFEATLAEELAQPAANAPPASADSPIAFICAEYAVHESLPIYSGGLGVLAGDFLKEASDRRLPLVAVGLLYRRGYFHQRLDPSGWQHESWSTERPEEMPVVPVLGADGKPLTVSVPLRGERAAARVGRVDVGRIPLFLLDTAVAEDSALAQWVGAQLYVGNPELRLMQYALLGVGAVRALAAMRLHPAVVHLNEGHPALASIAIAAEEMSRGSAWPAALEAARRRVVFTTHTPVAAGNESYANQDVQRILGELPSELGIDRA